MDKNGWKREIGDRLRFLTKAVGIAHDQEIADELGVGKSNWGNWRRGNILLPMIIAVHLKVRFGCSLDWLYEGETKGNTTALNARLAKAQWKEQKARRKARLLR